MSRSFLYTYVHTSLSLSLSLFFLRFSLRTTLLHRLAPPVQTHRCAETVVTEPTRLRGFVPVPLSSNRIINDKGTGGRDATTGKCYRRKTLLIGTLANWRMNFMPRENGPFEVSKSVALPSRSVTPCYDVYARFKEEGRG